MFPFLQAENEIGGVFDQHSKICTLHPGNMDIGYLIQFQGQYVYFIFVFISRESPLVFLMKLQLIWRNRGMKNILEIVIYPLSRQLEKEVIECARVFFFVRAYFESSTLSILFKWCTTSTNAFYL